MAAGLFQRLVRCRAAVAVLRLVLAHRHSCLHLKLYVPRQPAASDLLHQSLAPVSLRQRGIHLEATVELHPRQMFVFARLLGSDLALIGHHQGYPQR